MRALRDALQELPGAVFADLLESENEYLLIVDVPGATKETTHVTTDDGRLRIEARREKDAPDGFAYLQEDRSLFLDADVPLPPDAMGTDAEARIDRGVLELRLPKRMSEAERTIPIEDETDDSHEV